MKKNNLKAGWKSTLTGVIILLASLAYMFVTLMFQQPINFYVFISGLVCGILMLFSPDTLINKIEIILGKFFNNNNQNTE
jgi:uncharacterized membrane protein